MPNILRDVPAAAEKAIETDIKTKSGLNWLAVIGVALIANVIGVFLHF